HVVRAGLRVIFDEENGRIFPVSARRDCFDEAPHGVIVVRDHELRRGKIIFIPVVWSLGNRITVRAGMKSPRRASRSVTNPRNSASHSPKRELPWQFKLALSCVTAASEEADGSRAAL